MTRILLAGDTHGQKDHLQNVFAQAHGEGADLILQVGDFGFGWKLRTLPGTTDGRARCDWTHYASALTEKYGIPLYWICGNHENFNALEEARAETPQASDGTYPLAKNVFYIPRGTLLVWSGVRILFCGGGTSVDRKYRNEDPTKGALSWWPQERISVADEERAIAQGAADIMISHDWPWEGTILDRHLDPSWGEWAQSEVVMSRQAISRILANCGATRLFHGHLHIPYTETIQVEDHAVLVRGLGCDGMPLDESTYLLELP